MTTSLAHHDSTARPVLDRLDAATASEPGPLAVLDLDTLRANAAELVRRAGGTPVRVASKSVRCRAVLAEVLGDGLTANAGFRGIMSYALPEAIWLAGHGARDVLMGYPTADTRAIERLASDDELRSSITLMIDSDEQLDLLRAAAGSQRLRVCIDVDASLRIGPLHLGVRRSPIRTPEHAAGLARRAAARGFDVVGVMFYEAQIAGMPDRSAAIRAVKALSARELAGRRSVVVDAVTSAVGPLEIVNGGGTGSLELTSSDPVVNEVTAGSGLYTPTLFDDYRAFEPKPSLYFALPVVRRPARRIVTAFGGGYIASGPPGTSRVPRPVRPAGLKLLRSEGAGEVQTPLTGAAAESLRPGDRVWLRHAKAGELCERFTHVHAVEHDGTVAPLPTYRGEGRCFG
ncbi:amino acid deaminase/aldolase [Rhodococcus rhodnii]|uniref:Alanine racemase N-terminal domain-containing protein n=2 Tax=Rhodococcus rhodnii TaxID=38312 RepID=R7WPX6_9NOCA|nr:amino acid deaminase/aldolase [Rhodococcus rhodnii]EOM77353.1 hypothetical protein Rrhod_1306 [Rhodococcus rhodnii LMG 5362]TXG91727.1 amino acid deaminase/aldolase [Rhodococcus rhodnii]